jgi:hypothetical protein
LQATRIILAKTTYKKIVLNKAKQARSIIGKPLIIDKLHAARAIFLGLLRHILYYIKAEGG